MRIPFHKPNVPSDFNLIFPNSIHDGWLTTGAQVKFFEEILSKYLDAKYVVGVNSCTAALHLALEANGYGKGDKFIAPALTFVSTIECGEYTSMEPVLVDSAEDGFLFDLNQVEDIVKKDNSVKVIIPVHYGGEAVELDFLWDLADRYGLFILEDAAHALEAKSNNIKVGNTNYAAAFSFYANKNITTAGEGGALSTNNKQFAQKVKKLSLHGITKDGWNRFKNNGKWEYDITELGYKYNLTDSAAAFGIWQMQYVNEWQKRRKELVAQYHEGLKGIGGILLPNICDGHARHLYTIQLLNEKWSITRNQFIEEMSKREVGLAVHYKPIHMLSYHMQQYGFKQNNFPRVNSLYNSILTLPLYPLLKDIHIEYITSNIHDLYTKYAK